MDLVLTANVSVSELRASVAGGAAGGAVAFAAGHRNIIHDLEDVSPVTLYEGWSRVARLLLLASLAVIGSVGNVFMISAVMIEDHLKKRGNAFIVNVALADLLITGLVIPASAVVILSGLEASLFVCKFQWFLAVLSFMVTVLTLASTAAENYLRLCCSISPLTTPALTIMILGYWIISGIASGMQFAMDIGFDYCTRKKQGLIPYQATVGIVFVFMPVFLTFFLYCRIIVKVRSARKRPSFKPPVSFAWDYALTLTNMYSFLTFVLFWLPFGIVLAVGTVKHIPNRLFYNLAWFAISKSCINNILYCVTNRHFRNAYINLFHYCCCKTTVSFSRRQRGGEAVGGGGVGGSGGCRPSGDVRVHIIPGYNMYTSPQRGGGPAASSHRATSTHRRDVYEL